MLSIPWLVVSVPASWVAYKLLSRFLTRSPLDNLPGPPCTSILTGNFGDLFNRHAWGFYETISRAYGPILKLHGALGTKMVYVFDPKALEAIVAKDGVVFDESRCFLLWNDMIFGPSLIATQGSQHRHQRKVLNPLFSTNNMRQMTPILYSVAHKLRSAVALQVGASIKEVNMMDWMARTALELIGQGGLGYSFDLFEGTKANAFSDALSSFMPALFSLQGWFMASPYFLPYIPKRLRKFIAVVLPLSSMRRLRDIAATMDQEARLIFGGKVAALGKGDAAVLQQTGEGKDSDILSILARANAQASDEEKLSENELVAQISSLVFAATDTTAHVLARLFHLLAQHQEVQDRLRAELKDISPDGTDIPYDTLVNLPYLDAVLRETLRLHSPVFTVTREAREDTVLPLSQPVKGVDGTMMSEVMIPKDTTILLGIHSSNHNEAIWGEDALEWKPERWLSAPPDSVAKMRVPGVYSNLMTFYGGGRACIGFKLSQLEIKVVLAVMLRSFKFLLSDKDIYWNVALVSYPTVGKADTKEALPLRLVSIRA